MKLKHIAITCGNLRAGGAERVISILANKFVECDIAVDIYTWYDTEVFYSIDTRVNIYQIPLESGKTGFMSQMKWFRREIKAKSPDVVLSFLAPFNILTTFSLYKLNVPVLVAERNDPSFVSPSFNFFWKRVRDVAYTMADGVFVQTNFANSHFPKYIRKNATVIYNPVTFDQDKIGMALRHDKRKEIVSVTRLNKQKNVPMLLRSFCEFRKTHPDYVLTVYGEGEERSALEQLAISLQLTDCVSFPGVKKNIHELIAGASIFAMASNFEGMSNSLIEAMCLGLPCVSTRVSGATDLIVDGVNGFLINLNDETALTISLCKLADDSELSHNFGIKASELYSKLNVDEISKQWIAGIEKYIC